MRFERGDAPHVRSSGYYGYHRVSSSTWSRHQNPARRELKLTRVPVS
jgi:hypothetical protein